MNASDTAAGVRALRQVRGLVAAAYADDPLMTWIFPDDETRADAVAAWMGLFAETYLEVGDVDTLGEPDLDAIACWRRPGAPRPESGFPTIGGLLTALVGPEHARVVGGGLAAIRPITPAGPHLYLHLLAVRPERQGRGLGRDLVERGLARADDAGLPVHLETTNEAAVRFYRRLGFVVTGQLDLPGSGPHLWAMSRAARSSGDG